LAKNSQRLYLGMETERPTCAPPVKRSSSTIEEINGYQRLHHQSDLSRSSSDRLRRVLLYYLFISVTLRHSLGSLRIRRPDCQKGDRSVLITSALHFPAGMHKAGGNALVPSDVVVWTTVSW